MKKPYRFLSIGLVLMAAMIACNFPASPTVLTVTPSISTPLPIPSTAATLAPEAPTPLPPTQTTIPSQTSLPVFETAPCSFPVPNAEDPLCGYLLVPENRARPDSPLIRLAVAVFRSRAASAAAPDPVVHLAGGPGSSSLGVARYLFQQGLGEILERRDFIMFDQRGSGYSRPRLNCPERERLTPSLLDGSLSQAEADQAIVAAFRECHARLAQDGIDLSAYTSADSAADVNDLRLALGYAQLNLYGTSYGSRLALTVMRDFPETVRSAVLDSTYPPQVNLYTPLAGNAQRAFNVLFERCAADPACNAAYPDLRGVFYSLVDRLNTTPEQVSLQVDGVERIVRLDGGRLVDALFVGMYNPVVTASMPRMIFDVRDGEYTLLQRQLSLYYDTSVALGMQMSVQCSEEIPFSPPEEAYTAAQGVQPQIAEFFPASVQSLFTACQDWHPDPLDPIENQPVSSDLPTLILAGEYDPITPPEWGGLAAQTLTHAYAYLFPANGHWVTRSSGCALSMALAFWDNPATAPDSTCAQSIPAMQFDIR